MKSKIEKKNKISNEQVRLAFDRRKSLGQHQRENNHVFSEISKSTF